MAADFRETVKEKFPAQEKQLNAAFDARLLALLDENAGESREKRQHLKRQILPGIAAYETLQTMMPKDEALRTVHGYVEKLARNAHKKLVSLLRVPGLYRLVPGVFVKSTRSYFGPAAGFAAKELQTDQKTWRIDMTKCPYHDTCVKYHCPELCPCFCDSDDISYADLHPKLLWHRTKTMPAWALRFMGQTEEGMQTMLRRIPDNISLESVRATWAAGLYLYRTQFPVQKDANVACWYGEKEGHMKKAIAKLRQAYPKLTVRAFPGFGHGEIINHPELLAEELKWFASAQK